MGERQSAGVHAEARHLRKCPDARRLGAERTPGLARGKLGQTGQISNRLFARTFLEGTTRPPTRAMRPYLNLHISTSSLPQFGQSNVQSSWPGVALAGAMRASIMRVPQRGQSGLLIESEYVVLGLYVVTVRPHAHATRPGSSWVRTLQVYRPRAMSRPTFCEAS